MGRNKAGNAAARSAKAKTVNVFGHPIPTWTVKILVVLLAVEMTFGVWPSAFANVLAFAEGDEQADVAATTEATLSPEDPADPAAVISQEGETSDTAPAASDASYAGMPTAGSENYGEKVTSDKGAGIVEGSSLSAIEYPEGSAADKEALEQVNGEAYGSDNNAPAGDDASASDESTNAADDQETVHDSAEPGIRQVYASLFASSLGLGGVVAQRALVTGGANVWQVVKGQYKGNTATNKTPYPEDDPEVRIQKNVNPTDVENEFQVYMAVDALCTQTVTSTKITEILSPENLNNLYTAGSGNGFPPCYSGQEHTGNGALADGLQGSPKRCTPSDITFKLVITYEKDGRTYKIAEPILSLEVPNSVLYLKVGDDFICLENIQNHGGRITIGGQTPERDADGNYIVPVHLTTMAYNALMSTYAGDDETTTTSSIIVGGDGTARITDKMGNYIVFDGNAEGDINSQPTAQQDAGGSVVWDLKPKDTPSKPTPPSSASKSTVDEPEETVIEGDKQITTNVSITTYTWTQDGREMVFYETMKSEVTEDLTNGNTTEVTSISSSWWAENIVEVTYDVHLAVDKSGFVSGDDYPVNGPTKLIYGDGKEVSFPIPVVSGTLYDFGFAKVDDKDAPMEGVEFTLEGPSGNRDVSSSSRTLTSDSDGKVSVTGLPWGTYTLTETVPDGYTAAAIDPLQISYTTWPNNVTHKETANDVFNFPYQGKVVNELNTVTVTKQVDVFGDLKKDEVDHTIYVALKDKKTGEYYKKNGELVYRTITITDGVPEPASVTFEGVPSGEWDVMELASVDPITELVVNTVVHESDGIDIQIHGISATEGDGTTGNDANLVNGVSSATVDFTNTYAHADVPIKFTANKKWATYSGANLEAPQGKSVVFTLYRTAGNAPDVLEEVISITLDGTPDELIVDEDTGIKYGELKAWEATFDKLPNQNDNDYAYTYKVRETEGVDGYVAYNGNTKMGDNDYMTQNGGTITNRKQTANLTVEKHITGSMADMSKQFDFTVSYNDVSKEFKLGDGESQTFEDVPAGIDVTVTETAVNGYTTTYKVTTNGNTGAAQSGTEATVVLDYDTTVSFTNDMPPIVITGIKAALKSPIGRILMIGVLVAVVCVALTRTHREWWTE